MKKEETIQFYGQIEADELKDVRVKIGLTRKQIWQIESNLLSAIEALNDSGTIRSICHFLDQIDEIEKQSSELHYQAKE